MAHVIFNSPEKAALKKASLPPGTTLVESDDSDENLVARWLVTEDGSWKMTCDFVERERQWKGGEREKFEKGMTRERVLNFFLNKGDDSDDIPYREYESYSSAEYDLFKFIRSAGTYNTDKDHNWTSNNFSIGINAKADLAEACNEVAWVLERLFARYDHLDVIPLGISETTRGENGIYSLLVNYSDETFVIQKTTYGRTEDKKTFSALADALKYIQQHYPEDYYGD